MPTDGTVSASYETRTRSSSRGPFGDKVRERRGLGPGSSGTQKSEGTLLALAKSKRGGGRVGAYRLVPGHTDYGTAGTERARDATGRHGTPTGTLESREARASAAAWYEVDSRCVSSPLPRTHPVRPGLLCPDIPRACFDEP
ncbi:unnamed protein product [Diplocarpon coronariae]|uniref:Uncharacterized protein n=1 Tax=Diplocarpon coronariae TaxID=2795749 RepID=A0A218YSQ4_9HELO|nr:hypothetical protein JHW43_000250 [Diplocarpon mali]OWO98164.1 hypothetical protein B2J93_4776 [Marssonina coronariae]